MKVGIDPGLSGAIAFVGQNDIFLFDMPTILVPWKKDQKAKMVDVKKAYGLINRCPYEIEKITIEVVHSMPKQGVASTFTFGGSFYAIHSAVILAGYEPMMILPQIWKRKCGLIGHDKDGSRLLALKMYPFLSEKLKLKKHSGRSDAIFIAIS